MSADPQSIQMMQPTMLTPPIRRCFVIIIIIIIIIIGQTSNEKGARPKGHHAETPLQFWHIYHHL